MATGASARRITGTQRRAENRLRLAVLVVFIILIIGAGFTILKFVQQRNAPPRTYNEYQLRIWKDAVARDPKNPVFLTNVGYTYLKMEKEGHALWYLEKALKLNPKFVPALYNIGLYHKNNGDFDTAVEFLNKAAKEAEEGNKFLAYFSVGEIHKDNKKFKLAAESFEKSLADNPTIWNAYNSLGQVREKQGDKKEALKNYELAAQFNPQNQKLKTKIKELSK